MRVRSGGGAEAPTDARSPAQAGPVWVVLGTDRNGDVHAYGTHLGNPFWFERAARKKAKLLQERWGSEMTGFTVVPVGPSCS